MVLLVIAVVVLIAWVAANSWARGFTLAWEGCQLGAFDDGGLVESDTYSEGLAYASKNPPLATAVKQATQARQAANAQGGEGFVYRNTDAPQQKDSHQYSREGFTRFDLVIPNLPPSPAQMAATPTSPFVGHL
jgi:hypothetical protein